jgi:hypothetical protein
MNVLTQNVYECIIAQCSILVESVQCINEQIIRFALLICEASIEHHNQEQCYWND